jgi:delta14-sterol reductase
MIAPSLPAVALATSGIMMFVAALFAGSMLLPGRVEAGATRPDGSRIAYRLNGLALFMLTLVAAAFLEVAGWRLGRLFENFWSLLIAANLFAFFLSFLLAWTGRATTRPTVRSFFYGAVRDPALLGIDLKLFSYRPSLIGLMVVAIACATRQYEASGSITFAMDLWLGMVTLYLLNYFQFEHGMLHTWDIIEECFGWMLVWGDYVLLPFFYSLPGLLLAEGGADVPMPLALSCVALYVFGFWLFRGANQQKHAFRRDPSVRIWGQPARAIGKRLLVSGFWGVGRKLNYTGELCLYVAWTALAGWSSPLAWLLPLWLAVLLVHRAARDDRRCRAKYGALWDEYCRAARFRMIPFLY